MTMGNLKRFAPSPKKQVCPVLKIKLGVTLNICMHISPDIHMLFGIKDLIS